MVGACSHFGDSAVVVGRYCAFTADVGSAFADPVEGDWLAAAVVVAPDALAEQDRCDGKVDLVVSPSPRS